MIRRLTGMGLLLACGVALAQVDTSGGIGGTGINDGRDLLAPAGSRHDTRNECRRENSIGRYRRSSAPSAELMPEAYLCRKQVLQTGPGENIELHLWSGQRMTLGENSRLIFD